MEVHWEQPPVPGTQPHLALPAPAAPTAYAPVAGQVDRTGHGDSRTYQDTLLHQDAWTGRKSPRHAIRRTGGPPEPPKHAAPQASRPGLVSRRATRIGALAIVLVLVGALALVMLTGYGPE